MDPQEKLIFVPSAAILPGETLLEIINSKHMSQTELAERLGRPLKVVNEIIKGKSAITPETAVQLEQVLGKPAAFWNNLESIYRELLARIEAEEIISEEVEMASQYPYLEMARHGWVLKTNNRLERARNLLEFFGVTSFRNILEKEQLQVAFRASLKRAYSSPAMMAWLRRGVIQSEKLATEGFQEQKLRLAIPKIRALTLLDDPNKALASLTEILSSCGVALVVVKSLKNAPICGSARWASPSKALIQLSIRYKYADSFWFSLFHEIGHLLFDNKKDFSVDLFAAHDQSPKEDRADKFASDTLIPPDLFLKIKEILAKPNNIHVYKLAKAAAAKAGIHPGIILGRLQHEGLIPRNLNQLRARWDWVK